MGDFVSLYLKLNKESSDRDACAPAVTCPKDKKPAIFVMVATADTADPVSGIEVDVSKPTSQKKKTGGDGMAKFDPAKVGDHVVRFALSPEQAKKYVPLPAQEINTTDRKTTTRLLFLRPLPSLQVIVERSDDHKVIGGAKVALTGAAALNGATAGGSGIATFDRLMPGRYDVKVTLTDDQLKILDTPVLIKKSVLAGQKNLLKILVHPRGKVDPTLVIADPKVVLVKRDYMDKAKNKVTPHRLPVQVSVSAKFDGTGRLTCNLPAKVKLFDVPQGGTAKAFPLSLSSGQLTQGLSGGQPHTVYIEGVEPSASANDVQLNLELQGGKATLGAPVSDKLTCVRLKLDICKWRVNDTTAPALIAEADKIENGRYIHEQNKEMHHERAKLIVYKAEPSDFKGSLRIHVWDKSSNLISDQAQLFDSEKGGAVKPNPFDLPNASIPAAGQEFWVQGKKASETMLDTAVRLGLADLPDDKTTLVEGDRVTVTVIKTTLEIYQSKTKADTEPAAMAEDDQYKKGRYIHAQDDGFHHGRAMIVVKKVEPAGFTGKFTLTVWDVTAKSNANPRAELFKDADEIAKTGQTAHPNPYEFDYGAAFPAKGLKLWVGGKNGKVSGAQRDTEIRLSFKDHLSACARARITIVRFKKLKADVPSTPALENRAGNSPVNRHEWKIADPAPTKDHFNEDYAANQPLVLIENSVRAEPADQVKVSVEIEPAGVPVRWAIIRDRRPTDGDHKKIIELADNREAPSLFSDAIGLSNSFIADAVGSFHLCPYVNCNDGKTFEFMTQEGKRIDREPFLMMNLVLVRVEGVSNDSKAQVANCKSFPAAGQTAANFGGFTTSSAPPRTAWTSATSGWWANGTVNVIGGGNDGLRGLDQVFGGWIQHIYLNGIQAVYNVAPAGTRTHQYAFIANLKDNTHFGDYHYIGSTESAVDPADAGVCIKTTPTLDAHPILDVSPASNEGTGGDSAVGSNGYQGGTTGAHGGGYAAPTALPFGQQWVREMWDAPGIGCRSVHISKGGTLASFRFNLGFRTDLCFWTNTDRKPNPTANGPANRLYASVYTCTWEPDFAISFHARTGVGTVTTAKTIAVTTAKSAPNGRAIAVQGLGTGLETRAPFALAWYAVDARA